MPFCPTCGASVEGRYCAKCGTLVEAPAATSVPAGPPPPMVAGAGIDDNVAGALCYLIGFVTGIVFLVLEPYSKRPFVRFHAFQSIFFCVAWFVLVIALNVMFSIFGWHLWLIFLPLRALIGLVGLVIWLLLMYKAYNREMYQLPFVGPLAAQQAGGR
jgi:uncharacterized membrane protein